MGKINGLCKKLDGYVCVGWAGSDVGGGGRRVKCSSGSFSSVGNSVPVLAGLPRSHPSLHVLGWGQGPGFADNLLLTSPPLSSPNDGKGLAAFQCLSTNSVRRKH